MFSCVFHYSSVRIAPRRKKTRRARVRILAAADAAAIRTIGRTPTIILYIEFLPDKKRARGVASDLRRWERVYIYIYRAVRGRTPPRHPFVTSPPGPASSTRPPRRVLIGRTETPGPRLDVSRDDPLVGGGGGLLMFLGRRVCVMRGRRRRATENTCCTMCTA